MLVVIYSIYNFIKRHIVAISLIMLVALLMVRGNIRLRWPEFLKPIIEMHVEAPDINIDVPSAKEILDTALRLTPDPTPAPTLETPDYAYKGKGITYDEAEAIVIDYAERRGFALTDIQLEAILAKAEERQGALEGFERKVETYHPESTPTPPWTPTPRPVPNTPTPTPMPTKRPFLAPLPTPTQKTAAEYYEERKIKSLDFGDGALYKYRGDELSENQAYSIAWEYLATVDYTTPDDFKVKAILAWARHTNGNCIDTTRTNPYVCGNLDGFMRYCDELWNVPRPPTATPMPEDEFERRWGFPKAHLLGSRHAQVLKIEHGDWLVRVYVWNDSINTYYIRTEHQRMGALVEPGDVVYKFDDGRWAAEGR